MLLLTAGVGGGHVRAAEAVAAALRDRLAVQHHSTPVRVLDLLEVSPKFVGVVVRDAYVTLVQRSPRLVGWLYQRFDRPAASGLRGRLLSTALASARRLIASSGAEVIVSTHFLASELVVRMRAAGELGPAIPLETVVTDVDAHGFWIQSGTDRYFVAGDTGAATLVRAGVSATRIVESGIPIDPAFERLPPRSWARRILGLDHDRPVVLYSTGGAFVGPVERSVRALASVRGPAQIAVICGHAERPTATPARGTHDAAPPRRLAAHRRLHRPHARLDGGGGSLRGEARWIDERRVSGGVAADGHLLGDSGAGGAQRR